MKAADPKYCTGRIMAIKKGVNHSNNKERCSAGNLDDLLWKYCESRYTDLSCSDVHWNFWRMCNALRPGGEVCNRYGVAYLKKKEHKCLKSLQSILIPFYPWSAVCSLQSAVCVLHWPIKNWTLNQNKRLYQASLILFCIKVRENQSAYYLSESCPRWGVAHASDVWVKEWISNRVQY